MLKARIDARGQGSVRKLPAALTLPPSPHSAHSKAPIGRASELAFLLRALEGSQPLVYVHGVAGEGKTTLLEAFASVAKGHGIRVERIDGGVLADRQLEAQIQRAIEAGPRAKATNKRRVLLILDRWEGMQAYDARLATMLTHDRADGTLVAIGSRTAPSLALRAAVPRSDTWELLLQSLDVTAASELLARAGVPRQHRAEVTAWTHGHALSLVVLADAAARQPLSTVIESGEGRGLLSRLLSSFLAGIERADERRAIDAIALLRYVTEEELLHTPGIDQARVPRLFRFLQSLSFVRTESLGLTLHEAIRELIVDDFVWRNPTAARNVVQGALGLVRKSLTSTDVRARERAIENVPEIMARAPGLPRRGITQAESLIAIATPEQQRDVAALVARYEGAVSARICSRWMKVFPSMCRVRLDEDGSVIAASVRGLVEREDRTIATALDDPLLERVLAETARRGFGPRILMNRYFFGPEGGQTLGPELAPIFEFEIRATLTMAYDVHVSVVREIEAWRPMMKVIGLTLLDGATTRIGDREYMGMYSAFTDEHPASHGFVDVAAHAWGLDPNARGDSGVMSVAGARAAFALEVRHAIENLTDTQALARSKLLERIPSVDRSATRLQTLLEQAIESTRAMRTGVHRSLVERRANERSLTDAAAASAMSLATYKRHYKLGVDRIVDVLWVELRSPLNESENENAAEDD